MEMDTETEELEGERKKTFKTPILIGKIGRFPRKIFQKSSENLQTVPTAPIIPDEVIAKAPPAIQPEKPVIIKTAAESQIIPVPYKEPAWSGLPGTPDKSYALDILKSGVIIERLDVMSKPFWVFGRLANCDVSMAHPTISRHHAVLQFRKEKDGDNDPGFYLYDLGSTHGTFLNKCRLKSRVYARVQVGHMIKFGCSTRSYILDGPIEDTEDESELSVTELKAQRAEELARREEEARVAKEQEELRVAEEKKKEEERGVDWGMAEDADADTDLTFNPYAATNNEDLYIDDPKKTLRGYMEREGQQLEYDCNERGPGQFLCKVELPVDDERGRPIVAEVLHKGKKKEAVVQCALEACRLLDRLGVLRQATQESRKRKTKDWAENDYYDSDDDTFLDRTGDVERKRQSRIQKKLPKQPETYQSLVEKESKLSEDINRIETDLAKARQDSTSKKDVPTEEDSLESYMKELKKEKTLDKQMVSKYKSELIVLKQEHAKVLKLANIARPADLPKLMPQQNTAGVNKLLPMFGKRSKIKLDIPKAKPIQMDDEDEDDDDLDKDTTSKGIEEGEETAQDTSQTDKEEDVTPSAPEEAKSAKKPLANVGVSSKVEEKLPEKELTAAEIEKRRKKTERRLQQRQEKLEHEKQRGYEEDAKKEDYNMWVPPRGQSGDGRTSLNDKFGY